MIISVHSYISIYSRAQERKEIDDYGENDEYKNRKKHIYKEDWADSIYCPLSFQRRGKGNHAGKD